MATLVEDLFLNGEAHAYGRSGLILNQSIGAQFGLATDQRQWVRNANYLPMPMIPILLQAPRSHEYLPNSDLRTALLREMVENSAFEITGINGKLNISTDSSPWGFSGEIQEEVTDVKREPSKPTFSWYTGYNRSRAFFWEDYVRMTMMDEETKIAGIHMLAGSRPEDHLPDLHTFAMAFIEPDPTLRRVVRGTICVNMMPTDMPDNTMQMAKLNGKQIDQFSIPFSAISSWGIGVNNVLQSLLDGISVTNANPQYRASFINEIAPDVLAAANSGFNASVEKQRNNQVNVG